MALLLTMTTTILTTSSRKEKSLVIFFDRAWREMGIQPVDSDVDENDDQDDGDTEKMRKFGKRLHCTKRVENHPTWSKSGPMTFRDDQTNVWK